jgi:hypothetical protein
LLGLSDDLAVSCFEDKVEFAAGGFLFFEIGFIATIFGNGGDSILGALFISIA